MIEVSLRHQYPQLAVAIGFTAPAAGCTVLFGPSGGGKSTCIAAIAGLLRSDEYRVAIDGMILADSKAKIWVAPERRRLGVVFQDARLFPHLSVLGNLRFGLRRATPRLGTDAIGLDEIVSLLGLDALLHRRPTTLSGGERQRVAIGRALLHQPRLLLLDEPLASLDAPRKAEILPYLARVRRTLALPMVYVTHAIDEVVALADMLVLIEAGRSIAAGPLELLASRADLALMAGRADAGSVLEARVIGHDGSRGLTLVGAGELRLWVSRRDACPGSALRIRIPAREVMLATAVPQAISVHNVVPARVRRVAQDRSPYEALIELDAGTSILLARVTMDAVERLGLAPSVKVSALIKSVSIEVVTV